MSQYHLYEKLPRQSVMFIDMQCFYVSVSALLENLDVNKIPMAVVSNLKQPGAVVLSANRVLKNMFKKQNLKIGTGTRLFEIPKHPAIKLFEPKMDLYINMSVEITKLVETFVPADCILQYSIDELALLLDPVIGLYNCSAEEIALAIQDAIYKQFNIQSSIGLGDNILIAKLAMDNSKKKTSFAKWSYEDIPEKLWPISPLSEMWGIGKRTEKKLNALGIYRVGDLAAADLTMLQKKLGLVRGNELYFHSWGIDLSQINEKQTNNNTYQRNLSFGKSQMLMRDYNHKKEIHVVLLEMIEDVCKRAREKGYSARTISLGLAHSRTAILSENFYRSFTIEEPTNDTLTVYNVCKALLDEFYGGEPARQLSVRISNVSKERGLQLDLFDPKKEKRQHLAHTMDKLRNRFGETSILRAVSFTKEGTALRRGHLVGGHKK